MLTEKQKSCINELSIGMKTIQEISDCTGVATRTIYLWKSQNEEFKAELQRRNQEIEKATVDEAKSMLTKITSKVVSNIFEIANDKKVDVDTRLRANKILLDKIIYDAKANTETKTVEITQERVEDMGDIKRRIIEKIKKKNA